MRDLLTPTATFTRTLGDKYYELTDHLGNVRLVVSDIKQPDIIGANSFYADVQAWNNYYAFGMVQDARSWQSGSYRYGYQTSEKDGEISGEGDTYTTYFRMLGVREGHWWTVWGDVPADQNLQDDQYPENLMRTTSYYWRVLERNGPANVLNANQVHIIYREYQAGNLNKNRNFWFWPWGGRIMPRNP